MSGKSNETPIQYLQKVEGHGNKINSQLGNPKRPFKIFPTQDSNQPKAGFCPSGNINFALPKNFCTYQVISNTL